VRAAREIGSEKIRVAGYVHCEEAVVVYVAKHLMSQARTVREHGGGMQGSTPMSVVRSSNQPEGSQV
jgi:hypothetical protein